MRLLYKRILKNDQVIYGTPFQVRIPFKLQNIIQIDVEAELDDNMDDSIDESMDDGCDLLPEPEELLEKAKQESELIIREAGFEAERLLAQARQQAEKKAEQLFEEAWQKGYAEGMEAASVQQEGILAEAEQIRLSAAQEHQSILAGMEAEIMELVLEVARKAVAGELATNREVILQLIADALPKCSDKDGAVLRVSPSDWEDLNNNKEKLFAMTEGADKLEIKKDSCMKPGHCIIETHLGSVDAGVNTRLEKIEEAFREQLEEAAGSLPVK